MFASIKDSLNRPSETNFKDILKFETDKTYIVRLLPNIKDPAQTFFNYYHFSWKSFATGQFVSYVSPTTWGERCPLAEESFRIYKQGSPEEKERGKALRRNESHLVNVYVISDPTNPENEGKVKIMRYGNQLHKIIRNAIDGDDAEEFGAKIFDLSENGCNFRIKCEKKSEKGGKQEFVEYTASRFLSPSRIEGLDPQKISQIYDSLHDLASVFPTKKYDELKAALNEHFYGKVDGEKAGGTKQKPVKTETGATRVEASDDISDDDIPMHSFQAPETAKATPAKTEQQVQKQVEKPVEKPAEKPAEKKSAVENDDIKSLLAGLDNM
jgi:hypothetical protein